MPKKRYRGYYKKLKKQQTGTNRFKFYQKAGDFKDRLFHYGRKTAYAGAGAAMGYIVGNVPGAYSGARYGWAAGGNYVPKKYSWRLVGSNPGPAPWGRPRLGSNTGSRAYRSVHYRKDPDFYYKGPRSQPPQGQKQGAFRWDTKTGWNYVGGSFGVRTKRARGHRGRRTRSIPV